MVSPVLFNFLLNYKAERKIKETADETAWLRRLTHNTAKPGAKTEPGTGSMATVKPEIPANPSEDGILVTKQGSFHVHPAGYREKSESNGISRTSEIKSFNQNPARPDDYEDAARYQGNSFIFSSGDGVIRIINCNGDVGTFPLKTFLKIK